MTGLSYLEAIVVGALQGVSELFPISSLGHSVLLPALIGGSWARDLNVSAPESPYLAFIVGLHVATALALLVFFWRDWARILTGLFTSLRDRRVHTPDQRLAWLLVLGTIPVGLTGLLLEHLFRTTLGRPLPAAAFLLLNAVVLTLGERLRRPAPVPAMAGPEQSGAEARPEPYLAEATGASSAEADERLSAMPTRSAFLIGAAQTLALLPGISRSGVSMVAGLRLGLSHAEAARFSFLLATPVILAAGVLKVPDLFGPLGAGIGGQVLAGSVASFLSALLAVRFLTRYFEARTLYPFAAYCAIAGAGSFLWLISR
ncbi:MAG TPA: undecaprenyl-diphosphate phosphatase [Pseudonocardia sp.]|uniref:undecaprenyl-diphosphate phosphatase n=1 Tax=Pseudonocardia sp. TaxID=60912 RepID=UPI002BD82C17|nr:undecaprenyl-diphosphate phosphatase [Pseudonocardia sp.]HTF46746.1 undecaprenyl-diphosphate phosphatase [Pseudonocardia sp.]